MTCEDETQGQRSHDGEGGLTELHTGGGHHSPVDPESSGSNPKHNVHTLSNSIMKIETFFKKWANRSLFLIIFVLFSLQFQYYKLIKPRWCAWDLNPRP